MSNNLHAELQEVEELLSLIPSTLESPLHELVENQLKALPPCLRAWFVLAAGLSPRDNSDIRAKRINLAAALEALYLALNIHKHLLRYEIAEERSATARSLVGSMILAGDYCFSRSAELASNTNEPAVVAIFSEMLATVSEGHLRQLHGKTDSPYDEVPELIMAGVHAALELNQPPAQSQSAIVNISEAIISGYTNPHRTSDAPAFSPRASETLHKNLSLLPLEQQSRWQSLIDKIANISKS